MMRRGEELVKKENPDTIFPREAALSKKKKGQTAYFINPGIRIGGELTCKSAREKKGRQKGQRVKLQMKIK